MAKKISNELRIGPMKVTRHYCLDSNVLPTLRSCTAVFSREAADAECQHTGLRIYVSQ